VVALGMGVMRGGTAKGGFLRRLWRNKRGTTAIEFAMVALPFFSLLLAIFETTAVFFANGTLENAVTEASRQIRTGQVQSANMSADDFKNLVCQKLVFLTCDTNLIIDVRSFQNFQQVTFPQPLDSHNDFQIVPTFSPGAAGEIVLVR